MNVVVDQALVQWGFSGATYVLAAARENAVYRVSHGAQTYALRLHRVGYRTDAQLLSELQWMKAAGDGGLAVPAPVKSASGEFLHHAEGIQIDILQWLNGVTLEAAMVQAALSQQIALFERLGREMALLHQISDAWQPAPTFERVSWDRAGLVGETPLWGRFWDNPNLSAQDKQRLVEFRTLANQDLALASSELDFGLIHADLVPGNVLTHEGHIKLIDFDDGGFGYRLFDLVTALHKFHAHPHYANLKAALLNGYLSKRALDLSAFELFMALRAVTYVGWNIARMHEAGGEERNLRFIANARRHVMTYLETR